MRTVTLESNAIPIPPHLAGLLKAALGRAGNGFDEAAFLQQLHYWTMNPNTSGHCIDGVKWVYNSLKAWLSQFCWMSEYGLRKAIANLKKLGLIQTAQHWRSTYRQVMFYRIDYDRLQTFSGLACDLSTPPSANSDRIEISSIHTCDPETSSDPSLIKQQTEDIVVDENEVQMQHQVISSGDRALESIDARAIAQTNPSSGESEASQLPDFPELLEAVAQVVRSQKGAGLPLNLKRAVRQFPERVIGAIRYLQQQQRRRQIENPGGYLYRAIIEGWQVSQQEGAIPFQGRDAIAPIGFKVWFDQMQEKGLVLAATTIDGVHHTLHVEQGWVPTCQLMGEG